MQKQNEIITERLKRGMSRSTLADLSGLSPKKLTAIEGERITASDADLRAIFSALNLKDYEAKQCTMS
jgi:transcriptional regulator with XRE-family HTH domain